MQNPSKHKLPPIIWALLFGNFVIGTGAMVVAGMMNQLVTSLGVSVAQAAQLLTPFAVVCGIGAPVFAAVLTRFDRRAVLVCAMLIYAVGHLLAALTQSYVLLLIIRGFTAVGAAIFTPCAAAVAGNAVHPSQRGKAVGMVFLGWGVASVVGVPLGSFVAAMSDWHFVMYLETVLCVLAALAVWRYTPTGLQAQRVDLEAFIGVVRHPVVIRIVTVTVLSSCALFCMFAYLAPLYQTVVGASAAQIPLAFAAYGLAGFMGNIWMARNIDRLGAGRFVTLCLCMSGLVLMLWPISSFSFTLALLVAFTWGLPGFATNGAQQARLVQVSPELAPVTVAFNTSALYLGQAIGTVVGGIYYTHGPVLYLPWLAAGFTLFAMLFSRSLLLKYRA